MGYRGFLGATAMIVGLSVGGASAQTSAVPAEFPPASYTSNQYVDSNGCAFIRAGVGGNVTWVPRVTRAREQLCNFQPSLAAGTTVAAAPARPAPVPVAPLNAPVIEITQAPTPAAPARQARNVGAPIEAVASVTSRPRIAAATPVAPLNAPVISITPPRAATAATPQVINTPAAAPRITLAEACEGRFGVQRGFVSAQTGRPIDCGAAPATTQQVAALSAPATVAPTANTPRIMTWDQICQDIAATGRRYVLSGTGEPVRCGPQSQVLTAGSTLVASAPAVSAPSTTIARAAGPAQGCGIPYLTGGNGLNVRCGPQRQSLTGGQTTEVSRSTRSPATAPLFAPRIPASNPVISTRSVARAATPTIPSGYERVWGDGRLNAQRGLPKNNGSW